MAKVRARSIDEGFTDNDVCSLNVGVYKNKEPYERIPHSSDRPGRCLLRHPRSATERRDQNRLLRRNRRCTAVYTQASVIEQAPSPILNQFFPLTFAASLCYV
jgi:hypothetical protein